MVEAAVLSLLLAVSALSVSFYRVLNYQRMHAESSVTAACLAGEQLALMAAKPASYLRGGAVIPWLGEGTSPVKMNGREFHIASEVSEVSAPDRIFSAGVTVSWEERGKKFSRSYERALICRE